ncbi:hypothetical protein [Reyranella sp.]|uniref:hypothetical protein n=1 Tax=Reyranella sp. TaxID=1929291 RepID=UPI0027318793|nr:hypothetical protein [Reyranella sp.]MDP2377557.1 hypothetical protein [Reyranella sp.]
MAVLALVCLGACAQPASYSAMIVDAQAVDTARGPAASYRDTLVVAPVTGGKETSPLWTSQVGNAEFQEALTRSLIATKLASANILANPSAANGRYRLEAVLQNLQQPLMGFDLTVTATVAYKLTEIATGTVVYESTLVTPATATVGDAVIAVERLKLANEKAIRANLTKLVGELFALPDRSVDGGQRSS